jgi:tRNA-2-methylthio-N6-dimethylallyladenosine synthase
VRKETKKFYIETYGCQMNVSDSEIVNSILQENGFIEAVTIDEADIIIFNTCSVRQNAEERVLGRIRNEIARKILKPNLLIGVIGCMAQRLGDKLSKQANRVDFVVGVDNYRQLPQIIANSSKKGVLSDFTQQYADELYSEFKPVRKNNLNAFITIMRGCDNYCSYCIVPYLRGRERSRPSADILKEAETAGSEGYKDITLLGQNVNSYHWNNTDFSRLLSLLNKIETIERIRFITSHPKDLSPKLIETMAQCSKVCEHLHLPLQSGNDKVLKRMNRGYTYSHYREIVRTLRLSIPDIAITTDLIAGFPGESDKDFSDTLEAMKEIRFDFAYMFRYSPREGTKAFLVNDDIPEQDKLARLESMINLQTEITREKYVAQIGKTVEVFVEKTSKKSAAELAGKTRDFKIVVFSGKEDLIGSFQKLKIVDAAGWTLKGNLLNAE